MRIMKPKQVFWTVGIVLLSALLAVGYLIKPHFEPKADWFSAIGTITSALFSVFSVIAVGLVWQQLQQTQFITQLQFEDGLAKEYRELASRIPTKALLGAGLSPKEYEDSFDELFRYIDLSNEQVLLRKYGRIGEVAWGSWCSGIQYNLSLPVFKRAWREIKERNPTQFSELKLLEQQEFSSDPNSWDKR